MAIVVPEPGPNALSGCSCVEISDAVFPDGRTVDLTSDDSTGELGFLVFDGTEMKTVSSVQVEGQTYCPVTLNPAIRCAVTLPSHASDYGSTESLFNATHDVFTKYGISEDNADVASYFVVGTWFPERFLPAPCLVITGPMPEATLFLQLLGCFVRRGLPMIEVDSSGLRSVIGLRPTLLIDGRYLSRRSLHLLSRCGPRAYVPSKGSVVDFALPKAIYLGAAPLADFSGDFSVHIHLLPSRTSMTMIDEKTRDQITADFQPKLLDYRLRNLVAVRDSVFDLPDTDSEGRVIAQMLGPCIVGSEKIQTGVRHLLQHRDDELRAERWTDLTCVVIEVLLAQCHDPNSHSGTGIHVIEIAKAAEVILKGRGAPAELEPRALGGILDPLKLYRTRDARGRRLVLAPEVRRRIHFLARNYEVESIRYGMERCDLCKEMFGVATGR